MAKACKRLIKNCIICWNLGRPHRFTGPRDERAWPSSNVTRKNEDARENEAARAADAGAWVRSAAVVLTFR